ncbi:MAG TPA: hypothetical protein VFT74_15340, partial [Isosphaeraceae bacterium]|nr:hypothetical protein [Isosphaeraceae bacterium]
NRRLEGKVAPVVRVGWIAQEQGDQPLVNLAVLMSRAELDGVIGQLIEIQQGLESQQANVADLLRVETNAIAGEAQNRAPPAPSGRSVGAELNRRAGLPPPPAGSLLGRSAEELAQADDLFRASLSRRLQTAIETLLQHRANPAWTRNGGLTKTMRLIPYADFRI